MKILSHIAESAHVRSISNAAKKWIPEDLSAFYQFLSPQWVAEYMGLKKLVEKDFQSQEDAFSISLTNVPAGL